VNEQQILFQFQGVTYSEGNIPCVHTRVILLLCLSYNAHKDVGIPWRILGHTNKAGNDQSLTTTLLMATVMLRQWGDDSMEIICIVHKDDWSHFNWRRVVYIWFL